MLKTGIKGTASVTAEEENSAAHMGSGTLEVFSTPAMLALIEQTALASVGPYLEEGQGTVGTKADISHDAPTPLGMKVTCTTELTEIDGRRLSFHAEVYDETGRIGGGTHERVLINEEKFQKKADEKRKTVI